MSVDQTAKKDAEIASGELKPRWTDFICLLGAYEFFRLPFLFMLPMGEAPDEFAHFWVIKFLREYMRLPNAQEVHEGGASAVYGSLPQLGYIPHVLMSYLMPPEQIALSERLGSLLMGTVMLAAAYKIGHLLFSGSRPLALAVPALIACHPQLAFIHAYANSDSTSSALASLLLYLALLTINDGLRFKNILAMGALSGWLALTKYSGLAVLPVLAYAVIGAIFVNGCNAGLAIGSILSAALLSMALSAWWFVQNNQQYPGDPLGTQTMYKSWAETFHREMNYYLPPSHIIKDHRWWRMSFFSFWGLFGYMNKYLWRPVYFVYIGFAVATALGWLKALIKVKNFLPERKKLLMWSTLALTFLVNIAAMIWASTKNLGGPQGRYLITSEIPVMALIVGGLNLLGDKAGKRLVFAFLAFNVAVCIGSFIYLFRIYGGWHLDPLN